MKPGLHSQPSTQRFWQAMPENVEWQVSGHSLAHRVYLLLGGQASAGGGGAQVRQGREKSSAWSQMQVRMDKSVAQGPSCCDHSSVEATHACWKQFCGYQSPSS